MIILGAEEDAVLGQFLGPFKTLITRSQHGTLRAPVRRVVVAVVVIVVVVTTGVALMRIND